MNIGILTFHFSDNYGAILQASALRKYLESQGHEVRFIDYQPDYLESGGKISLHDFKSTSIAKKLFLNFVTLREHLFGDNDCKRRLVNFQTQRLPVFPGISKHIEELAALLPNTIEAVIVGSDQIWRPSLQFGIDPAYFLGFKIPNEALKISYAPSFGSSDISHEALAPVGDLFKHFHYLSVREQSGAEFLSTNYNIEANIVPDPCLLNSEYEDLIAPIELSTENFAFCYCLRSPLVIRDVCKYVEDKYNLRMYSPHNPHRRWPKIGETIDLDPGQWLYMVERSSFVITNSFHGTVFSIIFNKPFVAVALQGERYPLNERVINLLTNLNLMDRFVVDINSATKALDTPIDWEAVNKTLEKLRRKGKDFLSEALTPTKHT